MLNYLWGGMIMVGIIFGAFSGKMPEVTNGALDSAKEAVDLCIVMIGIMSMWVGLMEIATKAGIIGAISRRMGPLMRILFPGVPKGHPAEKHITTNMIANFLGLGWAATPAGIMAMKSLQEINPNRDKSVASCDMCTFLIINISSLQLIPINIIAYRSQYGSVNPAGIVGAGIVATTVSTIAGVMFAVVMRKKFNKKYLNSIISGSIIISRFYLESSDFMERDMTVGSPTKVIINFTIPLFIGNVFQQLYNMADTIIVGKFVGSKALAAVGSTGMIMFLILGFLMGLTAGFTVPTSQKFGAGDMESVRKTVGSAAILSAIVSVIMTIISMTGMKALLTLMNTPDDIFGDAYAYIMVICGGIFAQVLYNLLSSILRALGNSKTPLYFLIIAAVLNIILDLVFIIVFHMGAAGAAYATVVSQGVSGVLCLLYIIKKVPILKMTKDDWKLDWNLVKIQLGVGFPMALQYSITAVGSIMMQSALNILGSVAIAGFTAASKIEQLATQAYMALGTTMATYCAQNMGAGKISRIRKGFKSATIMGFTYSIVTGVILMTVGKYMTPLFISENLVEITGYVDIYLKCVSLFFIPLTIVNVHRNGIQGMGYGLLPMMAGVAELIGRGAVAVVAARYKSYVGVCMASPAAWILASSLLLFMYFHIMKKYKGDLV